MDFFRAILGLVFFCFLSWLLSSHKRRFPFRVVAFGLVLQLALAGMILGTSGGRVVFEGAARFYENLIAKTLPGAEFVFGPLADPEQMGAIFGEDGAFVFAFAGTGLVAIISFSALMSILYHFGIMQVVVWALGRVMSALMGVSGAESMSVAANVFVGQTEAPLVVRPYIGSMTMSELNALMTGGFATIAGSVLAIYMGFLGPELGPHLLTASVMSAPAAFLVAKIMLPETEETVTGTGIKLRVDRTAHNAIEAAANGTQDGLKLWLNVIAMLITFITLVHIIDWPLGWFGGTMGVELSLSRIFGWVFAPVAWMMGIEGWHDSQLFGSLLGTKIAVNEFVAMKDLKDFALGSDGGVSLFEHKRTGAMAAYALCGFANFSSIGIQIGGLSPLAPERKGDLARLALRAMLGGAFASWMTATVAGIFL